MTMTSNNIRKTRSDKFQFTESDCKKIEKMASLGLSITQISAIFGISTDTFYRRASEDNIDLSAAITRGRARAILKVSNKAYELAMKGDTSMIKYFLSSVAGLNNSTNKQVEEVRTITDDELEKATYARMFEILDFIPPKELENFIAFHQREQKVVSYENNCSR